MRDIQDVLHFRSDLPPFLVHMTRGGHHVREGAGPRTPSQNLHSILSEKAILAGRHGPWTSDARFGRRTVNMTEADQRRFFHGLSFTEAPLNEVHCLLDIRGRAVNLSPYGIVFLKENLASRGVAPVTYLNNKNGDMDPVVRGLCALIDSDPETAERVLPMISVFGQKLRAPGAPAHSPGALVDFRWEREWRLPATKAPLGFETEDVFIGLCPHEEIEEFEAAFPELGFIDPRMNMRWYATKLIEARQRLDMRYSVV